jgi:MerR family transcriptional regulator, heat shock protein HspR
MTDEISADQMSEAKILIISVAARMAGMHPQTLRQYDRLGLVEAARTAGGGRRYSVRDVEMLREIQRLSQDEGISLAGVKRIIELEQAVAEMQQRVSEVAAELNAAYDRITELESLFPFPRRDLMPTSRTSTEVVLYRNPL